MTHILFLIIALVDVQFTQDPPNETLGRLDVGFSSTTAHHAP